MALIYESQSQGPTAPQGLALCALAMCGLMAGYHIAATPGPATWAFQAPSVTQNAPAATLQRPQAINQFIPAHGPTVRSRPAMAPVGAAPRDLPDMVSPAELPQSHEIETQPKSWYAVCLAVVSVMGANLLMLARKWKKSQEPPSATALLASSGVAVVEGGKGRSQGIKPGTPRERYPAKDLCSRCGLCDTYLIEHVRQSCAFLEEGMSKAETLEPQVHGRSRRHDTDELNFGVHEEMLYATNVKPSWDITPQPEGYASDKGTAQWTGVVTQMAITMLETGMVDGVVCVQSDPEDRFTPKPIIARSAAEIIAAKGVKPSYSPNLSVLAYLEALPDVKKLLFIGVGCQVSAVRSIEKYLGLEELYVIGTNCADNGPREGLQKFLDVASQSPDTVIGYEFMQDYQVHLKHLPGSPVPDDYETIPYFSLPSNYLAHDVIGQPCRSCFDYTNSLADIVVGYMGVPYFQKPMTKHPQHVTVRNQKGRQMLDLIRDRLEVLPTIDTGNRKPFVLTTLEADDAAFFGKAPPTGPPKFVANLLPSILQFVGPKGLEFGRYSLDYHILRNWLYVNRKMGRAQAERHVPPYAKKIVAEYNQNGELDKMLEAQSNRHGFNVPGSIPHPEGFSDGLRYDAQGKTLNP